MQTEKSRFSFNDLLICCVLLRQQELGSPPAPASETRANPLVGFSFLLSTSTFVLVPINS